MADHSNEPTATEERAAANQAGSKIQPIPGDADVDPETGMARGQDDRSPLDPGMAFDPLGKNPNDPAVTS